MTPNQIKLARHALGLDGRKCSYRNRYFAGAGHFAYADWCAMVASGDAVREPGTRNDGFHLTLTGAMKALIPGESLDREDFAAAIAA